jgi:hypothetical protein
VESRLVRSEHVKVMVTTGTEKELDLPFLNIPFEQFHLSDSFPNICQLERGH